jgi:hypothetical protein
MNRQALCGQVWELSQTEMKQCEGGLGLKAAPAPVAMYALGTIVFVKSWAQRNRGDDPGAYDDDDLPSG